MKKIFLILLLGILIGTLGWRYCQRTGDMMDHTREVAAGTTQQATTSAREMGGRLGDAGIIALIKGKYVMDRDLSALAITIECTNGHVILTGTAASPELMTRAADLARQTKGVTEVTSRLTVKN